MNAVSDIRERRLLDGSKGVDKNKSTRFNAKELRKQCFALSCFIQTKEEGNKGTVILVLVWWAPRIQKPFFQLACFLPFLNFVVLELQHKHGKRALNRVGLWSPFPIATFFLLPLPITVAFFLLASLSPSLSLPSLFYSRLEPPPSIPLELCMDLRANSMASEGLYERVKGSTNRWWTEDLSPPLTTLTYSPPQGLNMVMPLKLLF